MSDETSVGGHPTGTLTDEEREKRRATREKNVAAIAVINAHIKELPNAVVDAIKQLVNLEPGRQPNSIFTRILDFICGKEVSGIDTQDLKSAGLKGWPKKGDSINDMVLFKLFRVAVTDMNKVIYQGQDSGIWISEKKEGKLDRLYTFFAEGPEWPEVPEGYPGPIRSKGRKKEENE